MPTKTENQHAIDNARNWYGEIAAWFERDFSTAEDEVEA